MKLRSTAFAASLLALAAVHCGGTTVPLGGGSDATKGAGTSGDAGASAKADIPTFDDPGFPTLAQSSKVDILLAVDNSPGMGAKSELLAKSLRTFLDHVTAATTDVHLGVVTSSLGNQGGDVCPTDNPAANTRAHLQRTDGAGATVTPTGVLAVGAGGAVPFEDMAERLVRGVGENGCGLEAQLESMYRFLVQPDPVASVKLDSFEQADLGNDVDVDVLVDRKAFLRPDSLLVVLMLTDEDDSSPDPLSAGGFGWAFSARNFPGSTIKRGVAAEGTTAPRGTAICSVDPGSADCTSCGFAANCDPQTATCQKLKHDPNCLASGASGQNGAGADGFYAAADDDLNVRYHRMKERFGIDPQYPLDRYLAGFSASSVPNRGAEHAVTTSATGQRMIADYTYRKTCTNPIFAASLPGAQGDELCHLPRGPRSPELVVFGLLGGVAPALAEGASINWASIVGADPAHYDYTGIDPHMVPSISPRPSLASGGDPNGPRGNNGTDPVQGREWNTEKKDLQYACTFELAAPVDCADDSPSCDCANGLPGDVTSSPPLCAPDGSAKQIRGKAYPTTRELRVAQALGSRAMIGSICASPSVAYGPFFDRFEGVVIPRLQK